MDELDIIKAVPAEVVKSTYDDLASPALKEVGKFGADLIKTFRLALFPVQYAALIQERLAQHIRRSVDRVPEARRTPPVESLAIPIAEQLKLHEVQSVVGEMFENLLARAMDSERLGEAHPAFIQIIGQLAPDEATLITQIADAHPAAYLRPPAKGDSVFLQAYRESIIRGSNFTDDQKQQLITNAVRPEELAQPRLVYTYIEHLVSLGIVSYTNVPWENEFRGEKDANFDFWFIELNGLGDLFYRACLSS
ncbi:Abi-alpha family protein [Paraburkholderia fungorum]|uniref:Abi-alpha family protein n=1 Tax=Paraburkholderia fungorum TaxID=134537 RepID=UPI00402BAA58